MVRVAKIMVVLGLLVLCRSAWAVEPNLVSYWKFDEGSGTIAVDSVGGNHGTLFGDTVWTSSPIDGALSFDGDEDYVDCGNGASINNLTRFSVSLWFKADVIPSSSGDYFISQRDLSSVVWTFILHGDFSGRVAGAVIADGSNAISTTDFIPNIGEWYHGAMTYDDLGDRKIRIYINGTEQSYLQHWAASGTMASNPSVHVAIGNRIGGGRDFGGSVDEVSIYNRALSAEEIQQLYYYEGFSDYERAVIRVENAIDKKQEALETIDAALDEEEDAYDALEELLESKDYGDLKKGDIITAKQKIHSAMQHQEQSIDTLEKSIEKLEDSLSVLGYEVGPNGNNN